MPGRPQFFMLGYLPPVSAAEGRAHSALSPTHSPVSRHSLNLTVCLAPPAVRGPDRSAAGLLRRSLRWRATTFRSKLLTDNAGVLD